jgi:predicted transcriptional regulator
MRGLYFMPSPFVYRGINFCGYKIQKYISSNIEKVRKKQMKYLYMNEQERQIQYYQFPKFLLELQLSQNARSIYMLLYDRARISRKNNWTDEDGRVYAIFPIEELSQKTGKCKSSVKKALKELDDAGLLIRKFGGFSKPRHMYVMIPDKVEVSGKVQLQTDIKKADREFKNELSYGQNDNSTKDINTASNKVIEENNSSNKYGVSSYSIKNQKMNYECGEGESL